MTPVHAGKTQQHNRTSARTQLKRLFVIMSTAPVPEPKVSDPKKPDRPAYLRYIEYV